MQISHISELVEISKILCLAYFFFLIKLTNVSKFKKKIIII